MEKKADEIAVTRRQFFKVAALLAAGAAVSPKVLGVLAEDKISQAQLLEAMSVFSAPRLRNWVAVMHPETYRDLVGVLGGELGKQAGLSVDRLIMGELEYEQTFEDNPGVISGSVGSFSGINVMVSREAV